MTDLKLGSPALAEGVREQSVTIDVKRYALVAQIFNALHHLNAAARRIELFLGDPNLDVKHEAREIQAYRLHAHKALVTLNEALAEAAVPPRGPMKSWKCAKCGHWHEGRHLANICIGCPCPETSPLPSSGSPEGGENK